jgi:hypothetical protein
MKKPEFKIGEIVGFKGKGFGFGRVQSITPQRGKSGEYIYHVVLLNEEVLVGSGGEHLERPSSEDSELIESLDSIGNL